MYSILPTCVSVCQVCIWCSGRPEKQADSPAMGVIDGCGLHRGFWELNPCLEKQPVILIAEQSLQPPKPILLCIVF